LYLGGASGYSAWYQNGTEQARLTSSGLEIKQSQLIGYNDYTNIGTNGLAVAGNVGIGTASPTSGFKFDVQAARALSRTQSTTGTNDVFQRYINTGGNFTIGIDDSAGTNQTGSAYASYLWSTVNSPLILATNNTAVATFSAAGNLGLGVTPSAWGSPLGSAFLEAKNGMHFGSIGTAVSIGYIGVNSFYNGTNWIYKNSTYSNRYELNSGNTGAHAWFLSTSAQVAGTDPVFSQAMTLTAGGQLLVGTTTSALGVSGRGVIEVNGTSSAVAALKVNNTLSAEFFSDGTDLYILNDVNGAMRLYTNSIERGRFSSDGTFRVKGAGTAGSTDAFQVAGTAPADAARIDSSGNLLVGKTTASDTNIGFQTSTAGRVACAISADSSYVLYSTAASAYRFFVSEAGQINATSTSITGISDVSLKENIRDLETGLSEVMALKPRRFNWKKEVGIAEVNVAGFVAQEVEQVLPELVYDYQYNKTEIKKSLKMGDILPTLVKAIQEQQTLITALTARITALESSTLQ
jgi:hypothetical protein